MSIRPYPRRRGSHWTDSGRPAGRPYERDDTLPTEIGGQGGGHAAQTRRLAEVGFLAMTSGLLLRGGGGSCEAFQLRGLHERAHLRDRDAIELREAFSLRKRY